MLPMPAELQANIEFHHLPAQSDTRHIYAAFDVWLTTC
jgi:hypothetical protein